MARFCEPCRHHSTDYFLTACPQCGGPVKVTLLPPPNAAPEPMTLHAESEHAPAANLPNIRMTWYLVGGAAARIAFVGLGISKSRLARNGRSPSATRAARGADARLRPADANPFSRRRRDPGRRRGPRRRHAKAYHGDPIDFQYEDRSTRHRSRFCSCWFNVHSG